MVVQTRERVRVRGVVGQHPAWVRAHVLLLPLILLVALLPRLYGLAWDGGHYGHPDELHIVDVTISRLHLPGRGVQLNALLDADRSPMNPRRVMPDPNEPDELHPSGQHFSYSYGSLLVYALKGVSNLTSLVLGERFAGWESIYLVGRALSALADCITVLALYWLGKRLFCRRVGLLAAALSAFAVLQIQYSHFYVAEPLMTMFLTLALLLTVQALHRGTGGPRIDLGSGAAAGAGACLGLAVATKPSALAFAGSGLIILFVIAASRPAGAQNPRSLAGRLVRVLARGLRGAAPAALAGIAAWALFEPYAVLDLRTYVENILAESRIQSGEIDLPYTRQFVGTLPGWYHLSQYVQWGLGIPLGVAAVGGMVWSLWRLVCHRDPRHALLLAWIAPYLLSILTLETKWPRYMVPVTPVLLLLAAAALWQWRTHSGRGNWSGPSSNEGQGKLHFYRRLGRRAPAVAMAAVVLGAMVWTMAFSRVYAQPHTLVEASEWIYDHVPAGSTIGVEHWDRALPIDLEGRQAGAYTYENIAMYDDLPPARKLEQIKRSLRSSDYVVLASNRLYGSIPRSPWRYAVATRYYELLFDEDLGFRRVADFSRAPSLGDCRGGTLCLPSDRNADESFSVYDHPPVTVFKKERALAAWEYDALFADSLRAPWKAERHGKTEKRLMLPSSKAPETTGRPYFQGVFRHGFLTTTAWLLVVELLGLVAWSFLRRPLARLPDGGWVACKVIGVLLIAWLTWWLGSLGLVPPGPGTGWALFAALLLGAGAFGIATRRQLLSDLKSSWRSMLAFEVVFLALFGVGLLLRSANPDLWQPYFGGEKPMELAFINGILRSSELPPYDPWFAGGYINYYYFGQWIAATLMRLSGVGPAYGFNLAVATIFALTGTVAAFIGYTLGLKLSLSANGSSTNLRARASRWLATAVGGLSLMFALLIGNLDGAVQAWSLLSSGAFDKATESWGVLAVPRTLWHSFDFWRSARLTELFPAHEFPFFTFLYGDLHAHMIAMPMGLTLVLLAAYIVTERGELGLRTVVALAAVGGLLVGALATTNPWDVPTYAGVFLLGLVVYAVAAWGDARLVLLRAAAPLTVFCGIAVAGYAPFFLAFKSFYSSVGLVTSPTPLPIYLNMLGLFLFVVAWYGVTRAWRSLPGRWLLGAVCIFWLFAFFRPGSLLAVVWSRLQGDAAPTSSLLGTRAVLVLLIGLLALMLHALWSETLDTRSSADHPQSWAAAVWAGLATGGILVWTGIEIFYLEDFLKEMVSYRMNTVFKFGLQSWLLLALGCAGLVPLALLSTRSRAGRLLPMLLLAALVSASLVYPVYGTAARLRWRFPEPPPGRTLNGESYMRTATLTNESGQVEELKYDYDAIQWLRHNVRRPETLVEAGIGPYRGNGGRVSMFTGMPALIGWDNHEGQQRYPEPVAERNRLVRELYDSPDERRALEIISRFGVRYIYVGPVERLHEFGRERYASAEGLAKFQRMTDKTLKVAYENPGVTIYEVLPSWQWPRSAVGAGLRPAPTAAHTSVRG